MPLVMKRSIAPVASTMPMAAYCAWTRSRTRSVISWRTRSMSSTPLMPRTAWSSADQLVRCPVGLGAHSGRQEPALQSVCHRRGLFGISADPCRADRLPPRRARAARSRLRSVPPPRSISSSGSGGAWTRTRPTARPISRATPSSACATSSCRSAVGSACHASIASSNGGRTRWHAGWSRPLGRAGPSAPRLARFSKTRSANAPMRESDA